MTESATILSGDRAQRSAQREALLSAMTVEHANLMSVMTAFTQHADPASQDYATLAHQVITTVDKVLSYAGDEDSLFVRNTTRPLRELREHAQAVLARVDTFEASQQVVGPSLGADNVPVYVLLFQAQGHDMQKWAQLLRSLGQYTLGRPIYQAEEDVRRVIRLRLSDDKEAYVKVAVPQSALSSSEALSTRKDRYGNALLSLPVGVIRPENILEFVHGKHHYHFIRGQLHVSISAERD